MSTVRLPTVQLVAGDPADDNSWAHKLTAACTWDELLAAQTLRAQRARLVDGTERDAIEAQIVHHAQAIARLAPLMQGTGRTVAEALSSEPAATAST